MKVRHSEAPSDRAPAAASSGSEFAEVPSFQAPSVMGYAAALADRRLAPSAVRVALIVGTILFAINHGSALASGKMNRTRAISGLLTYLVPYCVNVHGQYVSRLRYR